MMKKMISRLWVALKKKLFVGNTVQVGSNFHIGLLSYVSTSHSLIIGNDVYVGKFCSIQCSGKIGNGVLIANNVGIIGRRDHDIHDIGKPIRLARSVSDTPSVAQDPHNAISIGDDVWIGFGAVILSGVKIERGAIIAAGAVVRDDVEAYSIVSGNPASKVKMRFQPNEIEAHESALRRARLKP